MRNEYKGSCLCGEISFSVNSFAKKVANCHCSMCRKFHGAAYATLVGVSGLKWLSGFHCLNEFVAPNGTVRTFCGECGSSIGFRVKGAPLNEIELAIATFDVDIPIQVDAHIYTDFKSNWCELQDDLPKFKAGREA
ncbi:GFA family protein [Psychromonas sp. KJ10-10]|uniref:GFA family protein n=1 Tax=Psychromonas sp. KJ10-10 TaxID=3391823 RepID=UPI0039B3FB8B